MTFEDEDTTKGLEFGSIQLDSDGLDAALDAATEAAIAGLGEYEQLIHGIKAYLYSVVGVSNGS